MLISEVGTTNPGVRAGSDFGKTAEFLSLLCIELHPVAQMRHKGEGEWGGREGHINNMSFLF